MSSLGTELGGSSQVCDVAVSLRDHSDGLARRPEPRARGWRGDPVLARVAHPQKRRIFWETVAREFSEPLRLGDSRPCFSRLVRKRSGNCSQPRTVIIRARPTLPHRRRDTASDVRGSFAEFVEACEAVTGELPEIDEIAAFRASERKASLGGAARSMVIRPGARTPLEVEYEVRCRRCEACLRYRSRCWRDRALAEFRHSEALGCRAWLGTFTFAPEKHYQAACAARYECSRQSVDFDALSDSEKLDKLLKHYYGPHLTRFLARVRKQVRIRYLLVCELHQSGLAHFHAVIFETDAGAPLSERMLRGAWRQAHLGFCRFNLCRTSAGAAYVCKYISKSAVARIRASGDFGNPLRIAVKPRDYDPPSTWGVSRGGLTPSEASEASPGSEATRRKNDLPGQEKVSEEPSGGAAARTEAQDFRAAEWAARRSSSSAAARSASCNTTATEAPMPHRPPTWSCLGKPPRDAQGRVMMFCDWCGVTDDVVEIVPELWMCRECIVERDALEQVQPDPSSGGADDG